MEIQTLFVHLYTLFLLIPTKNTKYSPYNVITYGFFLEVNIKIHPYYAISIAKAFPIPADAPVIQTTFHINLK